MKRSPSTRHGCGGRRRRSAWIRLSAAILLCAAVLSSVSTLRVAAQETTAVDDASRTSLREMTARESAATYGEVLTGTDTSCIFIGDSRTVGMSAYVTTNDYIWSAKNGAGLEWMKRVGVPAVEDDIVNGSRVVCMMGFNDVFFPEKADEYADYLNQKATEWSKKGAEVFYVSVNPITRETVSDGRITQDDIVEWNQRLREQLSAQIIYIDTFTMTEGMLSAADGIHYNEADYQIIYDIILGSFPDFKPPAGSGTAEEEKVLITDYTPVITSVIREEKASTITLTISKPEQLKNVFYQIQINDRWVQDWTDIARVKTTTVTIPADKGDVGIRTRAYKANGAVIEYTDWSKEIIVDENGSVIEKKKSWWSRFREWIGNLF